MLFSLMDELLSVSQESLVQGVSMQKIKVTTSYGNLSAIAIKASQGENVGEVYEFTNELIKWVNCRLGTGSGSGWNK
jgi:hypothetical protein